MLAELCENGCNTGDRFIGWVILVIVTSAFPLFTIYLAWSKKWFEKDLNENKRPD